MYIFHYIFLIEVKFPLNFAIFIVWKPPSGGNNTDKEMMRFNLEKGFDKVR